MNAIRITTIVIAWINIVFASSILVLYSIRVPKRWITFPGNMMLTMLAVSIPVRAEEKGESSL